MSLSTLRRFSVGWLFLSVWLVGAGCGPVSPPSGAGTGEAAGAGRGGGEAGPGPADAAVDRILVTGATGGCGGSASCTGQGATADAGAGGASAGGAPSDGGAADPRFSDAAVVDGGSVGSCGSGGHAGAGGALASSSTGGAGGVRTSSPGGPGAGGAGSGGTAGQAAASGGATGGSRMAASGGEGGGGGGGGMPGGGGNAGRGGSAGSSGGGATGGAGTSGPAPAPAELRIVELLVNPAGTDTGREWIELANTTGHAVDLSGLHIADAANDAVVDFEVLGGAPPLLPAGGRAVLIQSADATKNGGVQLATGGSGVFGGAFGTRVSLNNDADTITVCAGPCRAGGVVIDEVTWTELGADYEGHALSIDGTGRRCAATTPFGDAGSFGTPGAANPSCP